MCPACVHASLCVFCLFGGAEFIFLVCVATTPPTITVSSTTATKYLNANNNDVSLFHNLNTTTTSTTSVCSMARSRRSAGKASQPWSVNVHKKRPKGQFISLFPSSILFDEEWISYLLDCIPLMNVAPPQSQSPLHHHAAHSCFNLFCLLAPRTIFPPLFSPSFLLLCLKGHQPKEPGVQRLPRPPPQGKRVIKRHWSVGDSHHVSTIYQHTGAATAAAAASPEIATQAKI